MDESLVPKKEKSKFSTSKKVYKRSYSKSLTSTYESGNYVRKRDSKGKEYIQELDRIKEQIGESGRKEEFVSFRSRMDEFFMKRSNEDKKFQLKMEKPKKLHLTIPSSPSFKTTSRKRSCDVEIPRRVINRPKSVATKEPKKIKPFQSHSTSKKEFFEFKAREMPNYKCFEIKKSSKELAVPIGFKLETSKRGYKTNNYGEISEINTTAEFDLSKINNKGLIRSSFYSEKVANDFKSSARKLLAQKDILVPLNLQRKMRRSNSMGSLMNLK